MTPAPKEEASTARADAIALSIGLIALLLWDVSGLDMAVTRLYADAHGFRWTDHWLVSDVLHQAARYPAWAVCIVLIVGVWKPLPFARALTRRDRVWWVLTTLFCALLIPILRRYSATSCPWTLAEFGGTVVHYVPHWHLFERDGGPGECFPSGHASTAFSFIAAWFALRRTSPLAARLWLACILGFGALFAWVQVMRGAHYLSHSLWTGWLCWAVTVLSFHLSRRWRVAR